MISVGLLVLASLMVEPVNGALGIRERLSPAAIDAMVKGAAPRLDRSASVWDAAGFRAGVADLSALAELTPPTISAFLQSDRLQVLSGELPIIQLELGGRGSLRAPE